MSKPSEPTSPKPAKPPAAPAPAPAATPAPRVDWKAVWPIPTALAASALLVGGIVAGAMRAPKGDPAAPLLEAKALVEQRQYEQAIAVLNDRAVAALRAGKLTTAQAGDLFLTRARAVLAGQTALALSRRENFQFAIDDFKEARRQGITFSVQDTEDFARALLAVGQVDPALEQARELPESEAQRRDGLLKAIVERNLQAQDVRYDQTLGLLNELAESPRQDADGRAWALARQSELRLAMGYQEEAITKLLRALPRMEGVSAARRGELLYFLGRAYFEAGQPDAAARQLEAAEELLPPGDITRAETGVMMGRLLQAAGKLDLARDRFLAIRERFPESHGALPATVGLAEVQAAAGEDEPALAAYEHAVAELDKAEPRRDVTWESVGRSLLDRHLARANGGDLAGALKYANLAERIYKKGKLPLPPELLLGLATTNRTLGEQTLDEAVKTEHGRLPISQVSPVTQAEAKRYLLDAGAYYREHALAVLVEDRDAYADSLWNAADCFDRAGDFDNARDAFNSYAQSAGDDDPRKSEARFRQAQVFQAEKDYVTAASLYRELVDAKGGPGVGPLSDRAVVPLASCYLLDDLPDNDAAAEDLLSTVVQGGVIPPDSEVYRDALVELGEQQHRTGRFAPAIRSLDEAVRRFPDHPRLNVLKYKLADAYRSSALAIEKDLSDALPTDQRDQLARTRTDRLRAAASLFEDVLAGVAKLDHRQVTAMDRLAERNSAFYLADAAFDLADYDRAIDLYDQARQRYAGDPASLVAMVQIVNAYVAQGKWAEAVTANERARQQASALPDSAWTDANLPIDRKHWERWLDSTRLIERRQAAQASAGTTD